MYALSGSGGAAERNSLRHADGGRAGQVFCVGSRKQDFTKADSSLPRASEQVEEESIIDDIEEDEGEDKGVGTRVVGDGGDGGGRKSGWVDGSYQLSEALSQRMKSDFESAE
jgi:hypothetical protein